MSGTVYKSSFDFCFKFYFVAHSTMCQIYVKGGPFDHL